MTMIKEIDKKKILERLLKSDTFKSSQTYQNLLKYLVNASINNESPKEYDIAIEVFGKGSRFNPAEDPSIRVYISNLRKKLKKYYSEEGKRDKIKLDIPPGHYVVIFSQKNSTRYEHLLTKHSFLYTIITFLLLIITVLLFYIKPFKNNINDETLFLKNTIWRDFTESQNKLLVVLGDDYFFLNSKNESNGIIRFHNINSNEDLDNYILKHPEYKNYKKTPYTFTPHLSLIPVIKLMPLFCKKEEFEIESSGVIKTPNLLKNDILFIGSFRNLYIMRQLLSDLIKNVKIGLGENSLQLSDSHKIYTLQGYPQIKHTDYCLFRKIPGPKNNYVFMLVSFFETGMSEASDYITNPETLNNINKVFINKYGEMPEYFDCLFRVSGLERTGLTIQIEYFSKIDPQQLKIW